MPVISVGPGPVENKLTVRIGFYIAGSEGDQFAVLVQGQVVGLPADMGPYRTGGFKPAEEGERKKGIVCVIQLRPILPVDRGEIRDDAG